MSYEGSCKTLTPSVFLRELGRENPDPPLPHLFPGTVNGEN